MFFGIWAVDTAACAKTLVEAMRPADLDGVFFHEGPFAAFVSPGGYGDGCRDPTGLIVVGSALLTNRSELQTTLQLDVSSSNMMLVAAAYRRWDEAFAEHLAGDFALLLWDPARRRMSLARDRLGLHQCYLAETGRFVAFASQPQPLFALPGVSRAFDERYLADYLSVMLPPADVTFYRDIRRLAPATLRTVSATGRRDRVYWQPDQTPCDIADREEAHHTFRSLLQRAVVTRLDPNRRTAIFLSGGLDSAALAATAAKHGTDTTLGLCSVPPDDFEYRDGPGWESEERRYVEALQNRHPNLEVRYVVTPCLHPFQGLRRFFEATALPPLTPNRPWINDLFLEACNAGAGTVMVGQLGNVGMSRDGKGYVPHLLAEGRWNALLREYRARRGGRRAWLKSELIWPLLPHRLRQGWRRIKSGRAFSPTAVSPVHPDLARRVGLEARYAEQIQLATLDWGVHNPDWVWYSVRRFAANIATVWAPHAEQYGLTFCDPSADVDLVHFCLNLPLSMHQQLGRKRLLIREAMADDLPEEIVQRTKRGRQAPHLLSYCRSIYEELSLAYQRFSRMEQTQGMIDWPRVGTLLPRLATQASTFSDVLFVLRALSAAAFLEWHESGSMDDSS